MTSALRHCPTEKACVQRSQLVWNLPVGKKCFAWHVRSLGELECPGSGSQSTRHVFKPEGCSSERWSVARIDHRRATVNPACFGRGMFREPTRCSQVNGQPGIVGGRERLDTFEARPPVDPALFGEGVDWTRLHYGHRWIVNTASVVAGSHCCGRSLLKEYCARSLVKIDSADGEVLEAWVS